MSFSVTLLSNIRLHLIILVGDVYGQPSHLSTQMIEGEFRIRPSHRYPMRRLGR